MTTTKGAIKNELQKCAKGQGRIRPGEVAAFLGCSLHSEAYRMAVEGCRRYHGGFFIWEVAENIYSKIE